MVFCGVVLCEGQCLDGAVFTEPKQTRLVLIWRYTYSKLNLLDTHKGHFSALRRTHLREREHTIASARLQPWLVKENKVTL